MKKEYTLSNIIGIEFNCGSAKFTVESVRDKELWFVQLPNGKPYKWGLIIDFNAHVGSSFIITKEPEEAYPIF